MCVPEVPFFFSFSLRSSLLNEDAPSSPSVPSLTIATDRFRPSQSPNLRVAERRTELYSFSRGGPISTRQPSPFFLERETPLCHRWYRYVKIPNAGLEKKFHSIKVISKKIKEKQKKEKKRNASHTCDPRRTVLRDYHDLSRCARAYTQWPLNE